MVAGVVFAVSFFVGLFLVGDQAGAFADSERAYEELFAQRTDDLIGSVLLVIAAIAFGVFVQLLGTPDAPRHGSWAVLRTAGTLTSVAILVAAAAFFTVPASLALGDFYDDPGIVTAQPVLPSLGYVMLVVGAAIPAAVFMVASARIGLFPQWFNWVTLVVAVALVVTAMSVVTMALLPIWVAIAAVVYRPAAT